jgi:hypothetical protein
MSYYAELDLSLYNKKEINYFFILYSQFSKFMFLEMTTF